MREHDFEEYLQLDEAIRSRRKAVVSRISKARLIERELGVDLDDVVSDDDVMYEILIRVKQETNDKNGNNSNALRKYYEFSNGKKFPTLAEFEQKEA